MNRLLNTMKAEAMKAMALLAKCKIGLIANYDPNNYAVKVTLMPEGLTTGWIPLFSQWVGNGWGMFAGPKIGTSCAVFFQENDVNCGFAMLGGFNDVERPLQVPSGEFWLVHQTGSYIKVQNDGSITLSAQTVNIDSGQDTNVNIGQDCNVSIQGQCGFNIEGDAKIQAQMVQVIASESASVTSPSISLGASSQALQALITEAFQSIYNGHTHNYSGESGTTQQPNQQMGDESLTTTVQGG
jgi:phage gp45-like